MNRLCRALVGVVVVVAGHHAAAVTIEFNYDFDDGNMFFDSQLKKGVLEAAGGFFSNNLFDDLDAITSSGGNHFHASFTDPESGESHQIENYSVAADTLVIFVGARDLGGSVLGTGGPGGYDASGATSFVDGVETRGEAGVDAADGTNSTDFAPWGGHITFDLDSNWYFDQDLTTSNDIVGNDFYSVALHELGHVLGYGTADSWDNLVSGLSFAGPAAKSVHGGGDVPLENSGHWAEGTTGLVDGVSQEAAMDPTLRVGSRKAFTDLDLAGLADIGWEVQAVPLPAAAWLLGPVVLGLLATARRR